VPYIDLVASRKRGAGVIAELRTDGVPDEQLELIDVPAGIDIGARTPAEIAVDSREHRRRTRGTRRARPPCGPLRRRPGATPPTLAVGPICGMTVAIVADTPSVRAQRRDDPSAARLRDQFASQQHAVAASDPVVNGFAQTSA
jgi:xanthine dehydrogenase accessory factor